MASQPPPTGDPGLDQWLNEIYREGLTGSSLTTTIGESTFSVDTDSGRITAGTTFVGYFYRYLDVAFATDENGTNFSRTLAGLPDGTTTFWVGLRNQLESTQATSATVFVWSEITNTNNLDKDTLNAWYRVIGARRIEFIFNANQPAGFLAVPSNSTIDLDALLQGPPGPQGVGITTIARNDETGVITIQFTNGSSQVFNLSDGTDGDTTAVVSVFNRSPTQPTTPVGGEWNFTNNSFTTLPTDWSAVPPNGDDDLWEARAVAVSLGGAATSDATLSWSTPAFLVRNGQDGTSVTLTEIEGGAQLSDGTTTVSITNGVDGRSPSVASNADGTGVIITGVDGNELEIPDGADGEDGDGLEVIYRRDTTLPATPSPSSEAPAGWSFTVPAGTGRLYSSVGTRPNNTGNYTWTPGILFEGRDGLQGISIIQIFLRATQQPTSPTDVTYSISLDAIVGVNSAGWSTEIPDGDDQLWIVQQRYNPATNTTGTLTSWSESFQSGVQGVPGEDGEDGVDGVSPTIVATATGVRITAADGTSEIVTDGLDGEDGDGVELIFRASSTVPTTPSPSTSAPTGWAFTVPTAGTGQRVYGSVGRRVNNAGNYVWRNPIPFEGVDGNDGDDGSNGQSTFEFPIYRRAATAPATPTGGQYNFTTNVGTPPNGWFTSDPGGSNPLYRSTTTATTDGPTGIDATLTWVAPVMLVRNGTDGEDGGPGADGEDGANGRSTFQAIVYQRAATRPATPTTNDGSFNFGTNTLTPPSGWSIDPPDRNGNPLWSSTGLFSISGDTGTDSTVTWRTAREVVRDGTDGDNGVDGDDGGDGDDGTSTATVLLFRRATTRPATPAVSNYNLATGAFTVPTNWGTSVPSGTLPVWLSIGRATGTGIVALSFSQANIVAQNGTDGEDGDPGADGTDGSSAVTGIVYFGSPQTNAPATPSADSFSFTTGLFSNLTTGWRSTPPTIDSTDTTNRNWVSTFFVMSDADGNQTIIFSDPQGTILFGDTIQSDNYVPGVSGWIIDRSSSHAEFEAAVIRGGLTASQINLNGILTLDGANEGIIGGRDSASSYAEGNGGFYLGREQRTGGIIGFEVSHTSVNSTNNRVEGIIHNDDTGFRTFNPSTLIGGTATGGSTTYSTSQTVNLGENAEISYTIVGGGGAGGGGTESSLGVGRADSGSASSVIFRRGAANGPIIHLQTANGGLGGANGLSNRLQASGLPGEPSPLNGNAGGAGGGVDANGFDAPSTAPGSGGGGGGGDRRQTGFFGVQTDAPGYAGEGGFAGQARSNTFSTNTTEDIYATITAGAGGERNTPHDQFGGAGADGAVAITSILGGTTLIEPDDFLSLVTPSDERLKDEIEDLTEAEMRVAKKLKVKTFKFRNNIFNALDAESKQVGFIAQEVMEAFQSEGLDALDYKMVYERQGFYRVNQTQLNTFILSTLL